MSFVSVSVRGLFLAALVAAGVCAGPVASPAQDAAPAGRTFGPITIQGNHRTVTTIIRRELGFAEGDPYDSRLIQKAWDRLEDLGDFAYVDIAYEDTDESGPVPITISVEEERTFHYYPLIDYDRRNKYRLGASLSEQNFRGRGEVLKFEASWWRVHDYRLTWIRPWFANRRELQAGLTAGWERAGFVFRPFQYTRWDLAGRLRAYVRGPLYVEGEAALAGFHQREVFREVAPARPGFSYDWAAGWRNRLTFGATLGWDTRDLEYYPTRGVYYRLTGRRALSRGFDSFSEAIVDLRHFVPTSWHHVIALHAWGREVGQPLPPEDRLYWGGPETIRGYQYASLEGEKGWLLSAEYRWPMFLMRISPDGRVIGVGVHFFWDAGDAWYAGGSAQRARTSWGAGAHINLSTQHFRFEVARTRDGENAFQFEDHFNF